MKEWLSIALRPDVVTRGVKVGAIVGTILVAINQGDLILESGISAVLNLKTLATYCVPYCVSTYVGVSAIMSYDSLAGDD